MALLREKVQTGVISCSTHVSSEGLDGKEDEICAGIAGHVWEATGFRFAYDQFPFEFEGQLLRLINIRYKTKHIWKNGAIQCVYECCQSATSNNCQKKPKTDPEQYKQGRVLLILF